MQHGYTPRPAAGDGFLARPLFTSLGRATAASQRGTQGEGRRGDAARSTRGRHARVRDRAPRDARRAVGLAAAEVARRGAARFHVDAAVELLLDVRDARVDVLRRDVLTIAEERARRLRALDEASALGL